MIRYLARPNVCDALVRGRRIIELGCGTGLPGMCARLLGGAHVVLTEQPDLINGIRQNVQDNAASFGIDSSGSSTGCGVEAAELSWGGASTARFLRNYTPQMVDSAGTSSNNSRSSTGGASNSCPVCTFDLILSCDCIYEPLYGKSWRLLAQSIDTLYAAAQQADRPPPVVLISCERRPGSVPDGVDQFLTLVTDELGFTVTAVHQKRANKMYSEKLDQLIFVFMLHRAY